MSHDIANIDGRAAMAYAGRMPWHQLGVAADNIPDVDTALKLANLDWEVKLQPMFTGGAYNDGKRALMSIPSKMAVVRQTQKPAVLGIVSPTYEPLQNRPAFEVLDIACKEFGVTIETAGALRNGALVWMLAKLPRSFKVVDGDDIDGYFLVSTGHDGATKHTMRPTPVRVVCANTIALAMRDRAISSIRHTAKAAEKLDQAKELVHDVIKTMTITGETFTKMAQRKLTAQQLHTYVNAVLGIEDGSFISDILARRRSTIEVLASTGRGAQISPNSLWNAYNAFTEYYDHVRPAEVNPVKKAKAQESALFGDNAAIKAKALRMAEQLLEVL